VLQHAIRFGRMAARLVHEQREERLIDEQRGRFLDRGLRRKHRLDVARERAGMREDVELLDVLPARLAHVPHVIAGRGRGTGGGGGDVEAGSALDDLLAHVGAVARHQALARAV